MMKEEDIMVYIKGRREPVIIQGAEYLGHTRPDGVETKHWHYYKDAEGKIYHFRKKWIQLVISYAPEQC